jgi:lipopolysaccharide biosynthesis regulator YciM
MRLVAVLALALLGCGPVIYINQVTRKASSDVEAARAAQADQYAPYYYTLAVEYLRKAREEAAHADFEAANRLGRKASAAARKAVEASIAEVRNRGRAP